MLRRWQETGSPRAFHRVLTAAESHIGKSTQRSLYVVRRHNRKGDQYQYYDRTGDFVDGNQEDQADPTIEKFTLQDMQLIPIGQHGDWQYHLGYKSKDLFPSEDVVAICNLIGTHFINKIDSHFRQKININNPYIHRKEISPEERMRIVFRILTKNIFPFDNTLDGNRVQFFSIRDNDATLVLRSSTGGEPINFVIGHDSSVVGLCLDEGNIDGIVRINPTDEKYRDLYLDFSFDKTRTHKSEFAMRLSHNESHFGVINFESPRPDIYSGDFEKHMIRCRPYISETLYFLEQQWRLFYTENDIVSDLYEFYMRAHAKSLNHDMQYYDALGAQIRSLRRKYYQIMETQGKGKISNEQSDLLHAIGNNIEKIDRDYKYCRNKIVNHIGKSAALKTREKKHLVDLVGDAVTDFRVVQKEGDSVKIRVDDKNITKSDIYLYETNQLSVYIHQIMDNSRKHLNWKASERKKENRNFRAKIKIDFVIRTLHNNQEPEEYGVLIIRDNGPGVSPETRKIIMKFNPGMPELDLPRQGTGRAIVGVHRYMKRHDGWIEIRSREGSFFEVRLVFPPSSVVREK